MHFLKELAAITILGTHLTSGAATPARAANASPARSKLETREELTDSTAIVNIYYGASCSGTSSQFTVTGAGSLVCYTYSGAMSIEVSAEYVHACCVFPVCASSHLQFVSSIFEAGAD